MVKKKVSVEEKEMDCITEEDFVTKCFWGQWTAVISVHPHQLSCSNKRSRALSPHFTRTLTSSPTQSLSWTASSSCPRAGYVTQGSKIKVWATKKEVDSRVYPDQTHCSYRMNTFNDKAKKSAAHKHTEFVRFRFQQSGFKRFCSSAKALASNVYIRLSSFFIFFHLSPSITLMALQDKCLQYGQERVLKNTFSISSL